MILSAILKEKGLVIITMASDQEVLTVKEICDLLRVHPSTIYKLIRDDKIPSFQVGAEWRFRKDVILRWMAEKSMQSRQVRKVIEAGVNGGGRSR
jgi:excisionase family DNA binding protein